MKSYGLLGVVFIVLFILQYVTPLLLFTGMLLIAIDAYTMHSHYRDTRRILNSLLINANFMEHILEEDKKEDSDGL